MEEEIKEVKTLPEEEEEEKETPSESSTEEKPDESEEAEQPSKEEEEEASEEEVDSSLEEEEEPKPVEGETPREKALRLEVERLRGINREIKAKDLFGSEELPKKQETRPESEVLKQYDPQELSKFREVLKEVADDLGYVKKDEFQSTSYQGVADGILDDFLTSHKEYLPDRDKNNVLWGRFKEEFALYKKPDNPRDLKKLFNRIHQDIFPSSDFNSASVAAQQNKLQQASHGGTTVAKTQGSKSPKVDPALRSRLKGFSDKEMEEYFGL